MSVAEGAVDVAMAASGVVGTAVDVAVVAPVPGIAVVVAENVAGARTVPCVVVVTVVGPTAVGEASIGAGTGIAAASIDGILGTMFRASSDAGLCLDVGDARGDRFASGSSGLSLRE